jgi:hypothetical protein
MSGIPAGEGAAVRNRRLGTAAAVVRAVQMLAVPMDVAQDTWQEFWDVVNGDGSFTDEELEAMGITAAQLASCVTVLENFNKFVNGNSPSNDAYRVTINTMRRVGAQL